MNCILTLKNFITEGHSTGAKTAFMVISLVKLVTVSACMINVEENTTAMPRVANFSFLGAMKKPVKRAIYEYINEQAKRRDNIQRQTLKPE